MKGLIRQLFELSIAHGSTTRSQTQRTFARTIAMHLQEQFSGLTTVLAKRERERERERVKERKRTRKREKEGERERERERVKERKRKRKRKKEREIQLFICEP